MITVIVPAAPDLGEQGFAEVHDLSKYDEQEVLFNIRSRFTVIEVTTELINPEIGSCRHLALLYGAVSMRRYVAQNSPCVEISIKNGTDISCRNCAVDIHSSNESSLLLKDIEKPDECLCMKCLCELKTAEASSYLCLSKTNLQAHVHKKLKGMLMPYKEDSNIRFYGLKCSGGCSSDEKRHRFSCIECRDIRRVWCMECFSDKNECLVGGHNIIVESKPVTFWCEEMSEKEREHLLFTEKGFLYPPFLQQGQVYYQTGEYAKALQFYDKIIKKTDPKRFHEIHAAFQFSAAIYIKIGNFDKALEMLTIGLKIINQERHLFPLGNEILKNIHEQFGYIYNQKGQYKDSLESYSKALELAIAVYGKDSPEVADIYCFMGKNYYKMLDFKAAELFQSKAVEIMKRTFGPQNSRMKTLYANFGRTCIRLGQRDKAKDLLVQAFNIAVNVEGEDAFETAGACDDLSRLYFQTGDYKNALDFSFRGLEIVEKIGQKPFLMSCYFMIANSYSKMKNFPKAIEFYEKAIESQAMRFTGEDFLFMSCYYKYACLFLDMENYKQAVHYFNKASPILIKIHGGGPMAQEIKKELLAMYKRVQRKRNTRRSIYTLRGSNPNLYLPGPCC